MASNTSEPDLTPLLPSTSYLLAYALPLLLISLLLTFAGTFLTLDRSRSFPPTYSSSAGGSKTYTKLSVPGSLSFDKPKTGRFTWILEGGIGGLAGGYAFGLHLSTALALLIPATTNSAVLSPKSFLAIWVLSCIVTIPLAGRYRYVTLLFFGVSGGTLMALALCIISHPALLSRIILVSTFLPLLTLLVLLTAVIPIPRLTLTLLHPLLRVCTASTGAFGVVMSIALLLNPKEEGWGNAWERLWMENGPAEGQPWSTSKEQGLSAAFAVFFFCGMAFDWALHRRFGECPDEKWDKYLAQYAANLPNQADRAGSFRPLTSFWDHFFTASTPLSKEIVFPSDADMKSKPPLPLPVTLHNISPRKKGMELTRVPTSTELLKKKRSKARRGGWKMAATGDGVIERKERKPVKFGEISEDDDGSDTSDDETQEKSKRASSSSSTAIGSPVLGTDYTKRPSHQTSSSSTPTLVGLNTKTDPRLDTLDTLDYDQEIALLKKQRRKNHGDERDDLDYSDYEDDVAGQRLLGAKIKDAHGPGSGSEDGHWTPGFLKRHQHPSDWGVPVPATPSLIKAIDRLNAAHQEAYGNGGVPKSSPLSSNAWTASQSPSAAVGAEAKTKSPQPQPKRATSKRPSSKTRRATATTPEDAEMGGVVAARVRDLEGQDAAGERVAERAPRWEEFWREVRVKAQT